MRMVGSWRDGPAAKAARAGQSYRTSHATSLQAGGLLAPVT